jgi:hypothetical protein
MTTASTTKTIGLATVTSTPSTPHAATHIKKSNSLHVSRATTRSQGPRLKINEGHDARDIIDLRRHECGSDPRDIDDSDRFPAFTRNITSHDCPRKLKPVGITKYDGKQDPRQWIRCYSTAIEVSGGSKTTKVIYFPMVLESAPLTWLERLKPDSIDYWEDLKKTFIDNFQGSMLHTGTRH